MTAARNVMNVPCVQLPCMNAIASDRTAAAQSPPRPAQSISGDEIDCTATDRMFAVSSRSAALAKPRHLPQLHAERLHDAVARDRLVHDVLNLRQLVLPLARRLAHPAPDASRGADNHRHKQQQHPRHPAAHHDHRADHEQQREELLQKIASTVDIAVCTRSMSLISVEISMPVLCR